MPKYFDIHSHLNLKDYDSDLDEVIGRLKKTETHTIVVGVDWETSRKAVELAEKYEEIYACIGIHPVDNSSETFELKNFQTLITNPKVVAIGECGLDFYHADKKVDYERQEKLFLAQLDFAINHGKPLMIHARDAYEELLHILEPLKKVHGEKLRGNIHFFAGNWVEAQRFHALGFTTSFTAVITNTSDFDEVIKNSQLNMIMSETDAPYVAPAKYRGKKNEPSYVSEVVKRIAELRNADFEGVRQALVENALNMIR